MADVARELSVDPEQGLSTELAAQRLVIVGPNELRDEPGPSVWERLARQFKSPLVYVLAGAVAVSVLAWVVEGADGVPLDALVIAVIVVLNAALGFEQERKAADAVASLKRLTAPTAVVMRSGLQQTVAVSSLVPGDVVVLHEGDVIPADGRIAASHGLAVAEAALTGESQPVHKSTSPTNADAALAERSSMGYSSTAVVSGSGRLVITATGMATEVGDIADLLATAEEPPTPLEREMELVGRVLGIAVVAISVVVVAAIWLLQGVDSASEGVELLLIGVSLAVAAVPEGLPAVLSLVLAAGTRKMASRNAVVKRLAFAETLGSTSVICTDKTGTLTRNEMSIERLTTSAGALERVGAGYSPTGTLRSHSGVPLDRQQTRAALAALTGAVLASDGDVELAGEVWAPVGDPTEAALVAAARGYGLDVDELRADWNRIDVLPFDSVRKRMSVLVGSRADGEEPLLITKGAPEVVLPLCQSEGLVDDHTPLNGAARSRWDALVAEFGDQALRTLAIAGRRDDRATTGRESVHLTEADESNLTLLGIVGLLDPPRAEAAAAVHAAQLAGIRVIMITGDHPRTATRIASDVGIDHAGAGASTGAVLDDTIERAAAISSTAVFARVAPRHKLELVRALQAEGHVVAMTGDGVNDAPALKAADIGVAMGISGSDVSKDAADMILADDNFATVVAAIEEGRAIFRNIGAFLRYLLSSNAGEVLTMFLGVVFATVIGLEGLTGEAVAPLVATQILWINLLTDTGPALAMGAEPVATDVMRERPRQVGDRLIDRNMLVAVGLFGLTMAISTLIMLDAKLPGGLIEGNADLDTARTAAFTVLVLAQLFNAFNTRSADRSAFASFWANPWLIGAVIVSLALQILVVHVPALNEAFSTAPLSLWDWLGCTVLGSTVLWVGEGRLVLKNLTEKRRGR